MMVGALEVERLGNPAEFYEFSAKSTDTILTLARPFHWLNLFR